LQNLTTIGDEFWIDNNELLIDISPLENLTSIGGQLNIINNSLLTSLNGLNNIDPNSINNLGIYENPSLSDCSVQNICNYLISPNGTIEIYNNAPGCNDQEEVEEACFNDIEELTTQVFLEISPNPCSGSVNLRFTISDQRFVICDLYEISGVRLKSILNEEKIPGNFEMEIELSDLPKGIYFCTLKTNKGIQTTKLIKL